MNASNVYDVIIVGSGPAGYTGAIYTSRAFLKTLILTGPEPGGQLTTTTQVENFPGFPKGVMGPDLLEDMRKQAERFGTEVRTESVVSCELSTFAKTTADKSVVSKKGEKNIFEVKTENDVYQARSIIIATGASAKKLGIPSEESFREKG